MATSFAQSLRARADARPSIAEEGIHAAWHTMGRVPVRRVHCRGALGESTAVGTLPLGRWRLLAPAFLGVDGVFGRRTRLGVLDNVGVLLRVLEFLALCFDVFLRPPPPTHTHQTFPTLCIDMRYFLLALLLDNLRRGAFGLSNGDASSLQPSAYMCFPPMLIFLRCWASSAASLAPMRGPPPCERFHPPGFTPTPCLVSSSS